MSDLENELEIILGRVAIENDMQVPEDVQKLAKTVNYLAIQLRLVCKDHAVHGATPWEISKKAKEILK